MKQSIEHLSARSFFAPLPSRYRPAASFAAALSCWWLAIREFHRSLNELDSLTDSDLRDLRIERASIPDVAWKEARRSAGLAANPQSARPGVLRRLVMRAPR